MPSRTFLIGVTTAFVTGLYGGSDSLAGEDFAGFEEPVFYQAGNAARAIFADDFNGDGVLDLAVTAPAADEISFLYGRGDGTFMPNSPLPLGQGPTDLVHVDLNGDGHKDLAVADAVAGGAWILFGDGKGGFAVNQGIFTGGQTQDIAAEDFNGDGHVDLVTSNIDSNTIAILFNDGNGVFSTPLSYNDGLSWPTDVQVGDLDKDGDMDIVVANSIGGNKISIFKNDGAGVFSLAHERPMSSPRSIAIFDIDDDGNQDIFIGQSPGVRILLNLGDGNFGVHSGLPDELHPTGTFNGLEFADFGLDGVVDLAGVSQSNGFADYIHVFLGRRGVIFHKQFDIHTDGVVNGTDLTFLLLGWGGAGATDFNFDGVTNGPDLAAMLANWGASELPETWNFLLGTNTGPADLAVGDFDGDGDADLAIVHGSGNVRVFLNKQISPKSSLPPRIQAP